MSNTESEVSKRDATYARRVERAAALKEKLDAEMKKIKDMQKDGERATREEERKKKRAYCEKLGKLAGDLFYPQPFEEVEALLAGIKASSEE